jgi:ribosomal-protein-alanine N-acetyltransferase
MDPIALVAPTHADLDALLAFELENRAFSKPPSMRRRQPIILVTGWRRQSMPPSTTGGALLGRVNLSGVRRQNFHSGVLGYRIGQSAGGRGYAT